MRVTYNREMKVKESFDRLGIECFIPMHYEMEEKEGSSRSKLVPAIHNLIFVHSTQEAITDLKMSEKEFSSIRYMMRRQGEGGGVVTVPDCEMDNFIRVASVEDRDVFFLENREGLSKVGRKVRITAGRFKDVVGVVKRIKRNRHVVVQIEGIAAVAITYIPAEFLEEVKENES